MRFFFMIIFNDVSCSQADFEMRLELVKIVKILKETYSPLNSIPASTSICRVMESLNHFEPSQTTDPHVTNYYFRQIQAFSFKDIFNNILFIRNYGVHDLSAFEILGCRDDTHKVKCVGRNISHDGRIFGRIERAF